MVPAGGEKPLKTPFFSKYLKFVFICQSKEKKCNGVRKEKC